MQTVIFLAAILFAIPTFGISLLLYVVYIIATGVMKAETRMAYADGRRAGRAEVRELSAERPSWLTNKAKVTSFSSGMLKMVGSEGVPEAYSEMLLRQEDIVRMIMKIAATVEQSGGLFFEQQRAAADFIMKAWRRMPDDGKNNIYEFQARGGNVTDLFVKDGIQ